MKTAPGFGQCDVTSSAAIASLSTQAEGVLTLAGPLPFPLAYTTDADGRLDGGYLYCLGAEIAHRAGLEGVAFTEQAFPDLVAGKVSGYDVALVDATVTPERAAAVSFAAPYGTNSSGVLARTDSAIKQADVAEATIAVVEGSLQQSVFGRAFPQAVVVGVVGPSEAADAVERGEADVAILDTNLAMIEAASSSSDLAVIARYPIGGDLAPVLPLGSANVTPVSTIIESMRADGTLDAIRQRWLVPALGGDPEAIPEWPPPV